MVQVDCLDLIMVTAWATAFFAREIQCARLHEGAATCSQHKNETTPGPAKRPGAAQPSFLEFALNHRGAKPMTPDNTITENRDDP